MEILKHNLKHLLIALDQFFNVFLCMLIMPATKHYADETLSSHCYRWSVAGTAQWPRNILDKIAYYLGDGKDHCYNSYMSERCGKQLPPEMR